MPITIGDIVRIEGDARRFVVAAFFGGKGDERMVRLVRKNKNNVLTGFAVGESGLTLVDSPSFGAEERVTVNELRGAVVDYDAANAIVSIRLDPRTRALTSDPRISVVIDDGLAMAPIWQLVLENKM